MKQLSSELPVIQKPDSDYCQTWFNLPVTQHILTNLKLEHQMALEDISGDFSIGSEETLKALYRQHGAIYQLEQMITLIESMARKDGDDE